MIQFNRLFQIVAVLLLSLALSSCFWPEEFQSEVDIRKDGTFNFTYDGILTFVLGKFEEVETGGLSPETNQAMEELENDLRKEEEFKKVEYLGHSKFKVYYEKEGTLEAPFYFFDEEVNFFSITQKEQGLIEVQGARISEKDIRQLEPLGLKIDGKLTVKTNGKVVEQNANSTPSLFGLIGGYDWKITSMHDPQPRILINIK